MLITKIKDVVLSKEQKQSLAAQQVRANCNSLFALALKLQANLSGVTDDNPNGLNRSDVESALGTDADSLKKFEDALSTFISTIENL